MKKVPLIYVENTIEIENMYHSSLIEGNVCYTSIQQVKFACNDLSFNNSSDFMPKISIKTFKWVILSLFFTLLSSIMSCYLYHWS